MSRDGQVVQSAAHPKGDPARHINFGWLGPESPALQDGISELFAAEPREYRGQRRQGGETQGVSGVVAGAHDPPTEGRENKIKIKK